MMPMSIPPAEGRGGGSALRIVEKLRVGNSYHLAAAGAVPRQRIVQTPAVEHPLEMRQPLRVGDVRHGQQSLKLISRNAKAAIDRLDGEWFGPAGPPIDLEGGHRLGSLTLAPLEHSPGRPEQILDTFAGRGGDGERPVAQLDQPLPEGQR